MVTGNAKTVDVNGISYRWPSKPVVVVCIDGGDPAYLRQFLADGAIPNIARFMQQGFAAIADGTVPSFTCPNNMSIITGTPASKHGISGNYYLDTATGEAVVMTGPELLRGDSIVTKFAQAGAKVVFEHTDGFEIARQDLVIRGPGEFLGAKQSGVPLLRFADLEKDVALIEKARDAADELLAKEPAAAAAHLQRWLGGREEFFKA